MMCSLKNNDKNKSPHMFSAVYPYSSSILQFQLVKSKDVEPMEMYLH